MFWKKDKKEEKKKTEIPEEFRNIGVVEEKQATAKTAILPKEYGVLKSFYVSEKATALGVLNQYVFKVFYNTTKNEIKKQVERSFDVKIKDVKIINLPGKARTVGRHSGFKPGFKKAIVVLEKGYSIDQAKA